MLRKTLPFANTKPILKNCKRTLIPFLKDEQISLLGELYVRLRDKIFEKYKSEKTFYEILRGKAPDIQKYLMK